MADVSEAAKARALEMLWREGVPQTKEYVQTTYGFLALARFIQEVSDALKAVNAANTGIGIKLPESLAPFILPEPVDPLVEAMRDCGWNSDAEADAGALREVLAKRGLKIVEADHA